MSPKSRSEAQQRADEIRIFQRELGRLEKESVLTLTEEQHRAVTEHHNRLLAQYTQTYDIDRDVQAKQLSLGMRIASFLGALALAASVFFLFYQFWGLLSTTVQVVTLSLAALGTFVATVWIQGRDSTGYFTNLAAMVAYACFVLPGAPALDKRDRTSKSLSRSRARRVDLLRRPRPPCGPAHTAGPQWLYASRGSATADYAPALRSPWRAADVAMLGQIFNITPSDKALIVWGALAFLLAYTWDLRLLLAAGILCVIGYVSARTGTWSGMYWLYFGKRPENFFPAAIILFLIPQFINHARFAGFAPVYRVFGLLTLFLPVLVLANWAGASYLRFDPSVIKGLYQVFGFVGSAVAIWLGARQQWPEVVNTGMTLFVIFLYTKFFDWWWQVMPKYLFFLVLGLTAILFIAVLRRLRTTNYKLLGGGAP